MSTKAEQRGVPKLDTDKVIMTVRVNITNPHTGVVIVNDEEFSIEFTDEIASGAIYYWLRRHLRGEL